MENAIIAITATDAAAGAGQSRALARFMLRSESVASSRIERITASSEDFARALNGSKANKSAISMVAATTALHQMIDAVGTTGQITLDGILRAHYSLMADDEVEGRYAGSIRSEQNWIGGNDRSPANAFYIPPPPELVPELMADLMIFLNRDDIPTLLQAAIGHAQFESIHPFGDGNGRIGRTLISAVIRRRGVARNTVIPLASGILALRDRYVQSLNEYRMGSAEQIATMIASSARIAAVEAGRTIDVLRGLPERWQTELGARSMSSAARLLPILFDDPVMNAAALEDALGGSQASTYAAIARLEASGIVREITGRKRDRVWAAVDVLAELDALDARIQKRMPTVPAVWHVE
jgi:Fic family protein